MNKEQIIADEGFYFGIGVFETIAVEEGIPQFLSEHIQRMTNSLNCFDIEVSRDDLYSLANKSLESLEARQGRRVLKLAVSPQNKVASLRRNPYRPKDYDRGFSCDISAVRRNETSSFTFHKTFNYGDNLVEKNLAKKRDIDEPLFLNSEGFLCEGATTNVFLVRENSLITPSLKSGLLPGIMRDYICDTVEVEQREITFNEIREYDEMFLTNSILDIMPVRCLGEYTFKTMKTAQKLHSQYMHRVATKMSK